MPFRCNLLLIFLEGQQMVQRRAGGDLDADHPPLRVGIRGDDRVILDHGGIDLNAVTKDYQTATQVQLNLQDPKNKIFDKADILNITCSSSNPADPSYPCTISLKALFAKNNPFLFINSGAKQ